MYIDGLVIISEALKEGFQAHLQRFGQRCVDSQKNVDKQLEEIEAHATVSYTDAIIEFKSQKVETKLENIGNPNVCINKNTEDTEKPFQKNITYTVESESSKTKVSGWSVNTGLVGTYQGVGVSAGATYKRQKILTSMTCEGTEREEVFNDSILVPAESSVRVAIEKRFDSYVCKVKDLLVTFDDRHSCIKCKIESGRTTRRRDIKLADIFVKERDQRNRDRLTVRLNGKCKWSETTVYLRRFDPEPLKVFRDIM